jgi:hypothetical protein
MSEARSTDLHGVKDNMHMYAPLEYQENPLKPTISLTSREKWGFSHNDLGRLLCPTSKLEMYDEDPEGYSGLFNSYQRYN